MMPDSPQASPPRPLGSILHAAVSWPAALGLVTAIAVGLSVCVKVYDPDVWWHIRVGQWIWENRQLPAQDPFSWTADLVYGWHPVLAELSFYAAHAVGGIHGVVALNVVVVAAIGALVFVLAVQRGTDAVGMASACVTTSLWTAAAAFRLGPKPELFSLGGIALILLIVRTPSKPTSWRWIWAMPLVFVVWSNMHRGGVMGAGLLAVGAVTALAFPKTRTTGRRLAVLAALCSGALLCNPFGLRYLTTTLAVMTTPSYSRHIAEWGAMTPAFLATVGRGFLLLAILWVLDVARRRTLDAETAIVVLATLAAVRSLRLTPIAALVMVPAASRQIHAGLQFLVSRTSASVRPSVWVAAALGVGLGGLALRYVTALPPSAWGSGVLTWRMPVAGVAFLSASPPPCSRMWNNLNFGGYLLYALAPRTKVFIDGRNDMVYSPEFYERTQLATNDAAVLREQVQSRDVDCAVVQTSGLIERRYEGLLAAPDFEPVYMDDLVTVLVRRSNATAAYLAEHGYRTLRPQDAVIRASQLRDAPDRDQFVAEMMRNVEASPDSIRAWFVVGLAGQALGNPGQTSLARDQVRRLSAERGLDPPPL